jgi:hypothetical protein
VRKLIASAQSDLPRAYICDECIDLCNSILEDEEDAGNEQDASTKGRFMQHPLAGRFLEAGERWAARGCPVGRGSSRLNDLRNAAIRMLVENPDPKS